ncbi:hypothetical protein HY496_00770 [Candidatus Woesearchaeota archaeon]|nr:hypothetical protein [Candidatus Woesearchaeota archaeon]
MDEGDYELLPHQVLNELKQDVEALKKRLSQPDAKINELVLEIESLKENIHQLTAIFQKVLEGTKVDDPSKSVRTLIEKTDAIVSQNETIARGMIAISDKLSEFMARQGVSGRPVIPPASTPYPLQQPRAPPGVPGRVAPRPMPMDLLGQQMTPPPGAAPDLDLPPPPPPAVDSKKRMGVFR